MLRLTNRTIYVLELDPSVKGKKARVPGSVAETMAPKKRQSVKKKSPSSCFTCFISITQPYINNLERNTHGGRY